MISKIYLSAAHRALQDSYESNERGEYLSAWCKTMPARLNYLMDAGINATAVPFYGIGAAYGAGEALFTWGRETTYLTESLKGIDNSLSRVLFGSFGATVSPAVSRAFEVDSAIEFIATAILVAAVTTGIFLVASMLRLPNLVLYNAQTGFTWGWH
jgi:hypothetical protein